MARSLSRRARRMIASTAHRATADMSTPYAGARALSGSLMTLRTTRCAY